MMGISGVVEWREREYSKGIEVGRSGLGEEREWGGGNGGGVMGEVWGGGR